VDTFPLNPIETESRRIEERVEVMEGAELKFCQILLAMFLPFSFFIFSFFFFTFEWELLDAFDNLCMR
jgi:hypothetical protein